jgi:pimeloyl-ACP methyl ester carboxylesterase
MATFVIVHGAWGGGWEWAPVADLLRAEGHRVATPSLTGLGDRAQVAEGEPVGLTSHVHDVLGALEREGGRDVVLCGASFGGMPATGAADRAPGSVRLLVYVDGLVPLSGQAAVDLFPDWFADLVRDGLAEHGPAWRVPMPERVADALLPEGSLPDAVRRDYLDRLRPHPARSFTEPLVLAGGWDTVPKAFVRCTTTAWTEQVAGDPVAAGAARAREAGWPYRELPVAHDPQLYDPEGIARLLLELGGA